MKPMPSDSMNRVTGRLRRFPSPSEDTASAHNQGELQWTAEDCAGPLHHENLTTPESAAVGNALSGPCLVWPGELNDDGYGIVEREHRHNGEMYAHRAMWIVARGSIPAGAWVLHHCDNRACVEPEHLYLGDNAANVRDRQARGRQAKGLRHGKAKLSDEAVADIRAQVAAGVAQRDVARLHGVSRSLVSFIVSGKRRAA